MVKAKKNNAPTAAATVNVADTKKTVTKAPKAAKIAAPVVVAQQVAKIGKNKAKSLKRVAEKQSKQPQQPAAKVAKKVADEDAASSAESSSDDNEDEDIEEPLSAGSDDDDEEVLEEPEPSASEDEEEQQDAGAAVDSDVKPKRTGGISVFVGNLPSNIKRERLIKLFKPHATVTSLRFRRNDGGQLFNVNTKELDSIIAFVDVPTEADGLAASRALNGTLVGEHILRVNLQRNARTAEQMDEKRTICVGNLAYKVTDQLLRDTFECCGEIEYVRTLQSAQGCKGLGFVCFADPASVQMAFELNGGLLLERAVRVERYKATKKPSAETHKRRLASFGAQRRLAAKAAANGGAAAPTNGKGGKFQKSGGKKPVNGATNGSAEKPSKKKGAGFAGEKTSEKSKKSGDKKKKGGLKGDKLLAKKIAPRVAKE